VPFPPASASFLAACSKPEAFIGNPSAPGIPTSTIDQVLRAEADRAQALALSDRSTLPILQVDEGFQDAVFACAARRLMAFRGYNRQAGADDELVELAKRADAYLDACAPGAGGTNGKRLTPIFVDSAQNLVRDGVRVTSHHTADWFAQRWGVRP
jgi:hypothetical protein